MGSRTSISCLRRGDPGRRPRIRHHRAGERTRADAGLVLRKPRNRRRDSSAPQLPTRAVNSSSATRQVSRRGHRVAPPNFDAPAIDGAGCRSPPRLDGDEYVINGRKYWPCNVGGWDNKGANLNLVVVRTDPEAGRDGGAVRDHDRAGHPGHHVQLDQHLCPAERTELRDHLRQRPSTGGTQPDRGDERKRRPLDQPQLRPRLAQLRGSGRWRWRGPPTRTPCTGPRPTRRAGRNR